MSDEMKQEANSLATLGYGSRSDPLRVDFLSRAEAALTDYLIVLLPITLAGLVIALVGFEFDMERNLIRLLGYLILGAMTLYAAWKESSPCGATYGKARKSITVVDLAGRRVSFVAALGRNATKYMLFVPLDAAMQLWPQAEAYLKLMGPTFLVANIVLYIKSPQGRVVHDLLANTKVVKVQAASIMQVDEECGGSDSSAD